jgi:hypothetical protein
MNIQGTSGQDQMKADRDAQYKCLRTKLAEDKPVCRRFTRRPALELLIHMVSFKYHNTSPSETG